MLCLLTAVLRLLPQVLKKDGQHVAARGMWDVLRRGTSQVLFSDLTEVAGHFFKAAFLLNNHKNDTVHHLSFLMLLLESDNNVLASAAERALDLSICLISGVNFLNGASTGRSVAWLMVLLHGTSLYRAEMRDDS